MERPKDRGNGSLTGSLNDNEGNRGAGVVGVLWVLHLSNRAMGLTLVRVEGLGICK